MPGIGIGTGIGIGKVPPLPPEVKFDLLENGLDFVTKAAEMYKADKGSRNLKYSVIHLCSGTELVFKEVIRNKDWRLLFFNKKEATILNLQSGDFKGIGYETIIELLERECKIKIPDGDKEVLRKLRIKRNKIEHFRVKERASDIRKLIYEVFNVVVHFINNHIDLSNISPLSKKYIKSISSITMP